ncbi:MAG: flagellar protein FlaG [Zoogloeaceae bacterium]|jgi:flagellar protein FlaG|nr:flagellar protein FlaG [Zoogloeaceae bacterium]
MDIASISGAAPVSPLANTTPQGRAPTAPVSRETLAEGTGGNADGIRRPRAAEADAAPVVAREEAARADWARAEPENIFAARQTEIQQQQAAAKEQAAAEEEEELDPAEQEALTRQKLQEGVKELREFVKPYNTSLDFSVDEESGELVVKVTDNETGDVIRQIPSEDALKLAQALDTLNGLFIRQKA